jgi:hypothetical protein
MRNIIPDIAQINIICFIISKIEGRIIVYIPFDQLRNNFGTISRRGF